MHGTPRRPLDGGPGSRDANPATPADPNLTPRRQAEQRILQQLSKQHGFINEKGTCSTCGDVDGGKMALQCIFCRYLFHAVCKDFTCKRTGSADVICCKSFYESFESAANKTQHGRFLYTCDHCVQQFDQNFSDISAAGPAGALDAMFPDTIASGCGKKSGVEFSNVVSQLKEEILNSVNACIDQKIGFIDQN